MSILVDLFFAETVRLKTRFISTDILTFFDCFETIATQTTDRQFIISYSNDACHYKLSEDAFPSRRTTRGSSHSICVKISIKLPLKCS